MQIVFTLSLFLSSFFALYVVSHQSLLCVWERSSERCEMNSSRDRRQVPSKHCSVRREASRRNKKKTHKKPLCAITSIAIHIAWILSAVLVYVRVYQFVNFLKASECRSSRRRAFYYIYGFFGTKKEIKNCSYSRMKMAQALARLFCMENYYESQ